MLTMIVLFMYHVFYIYIYIFVGRYVQDPTLTVIYIASSDYTQF